MKRLTYTLLLFFFVSLPLSASHIVGGEIELLHVIGFVYRVKLIYYFDVANNPNRNIQSEEPNVELYIFRKSDNMQMGSVVLQWEGKTRVPYTAPDCSTGEVVTDKIVYTTTITLSANQYSDPAGYYITWARCCRNYSITNIFSQDPTHTNAIGAGQTFYLEFPPVTVNNLRFINSSPGNFPALNDYACPGKPYYLDFAGTDIDGDSLAYSLVTPLSTVSVTPSPPATPGPYPDVQWVAPTFGLDRIMNGNPKDPKYPDLAISDVGFLRVTPRLQGLYVFAVKVEEFRKKKKIGEIRRDFQLLVTDCRPSFSPEIKGRDLAGGPFKANNLSVRFENTIKDADRCVVISVTDPDSEREEENFTETVQLKVIPLNFKSKNLSSILPTPSKGTLHGKDTIEFNVCFQACPYFEGGPALIGIIAYDDACSLPLTDTLKVEVEVERPHNERPEFVSPTEVTATLNWDQTMTWDFEAHDSEKDTLLFFALTDGFSLSTSGMKTRITSNGDGTLKGELDWDTACDTYDFTKRTDFTLQLLVDDMDQCDVNDPDTATYHLDVVLPENADPIIDTDLTSDLAETEIGVIEKQVFENLIFKVTGKDSIDNDLVTLKIAGTGFDPRQYGMTFPAASATTSVSSDFSWKLNCDKLDLDERSEFNIAFVAIDSTGKCGVRQVDSLVVKVKVLKPSNSVPNISVVNMNTEVPFNNGNALVNPGQLLNLQFKVSDADDSPRDNLTLDLVDIGGDAIPEGWSFESAGGPSVLTSIFTWGPDCSVFRDDTFENDFYFDFRYADDRCANAAIDTIRVNVKVKDIESELHELGPANVFTPNNDGWNDYYSMDRRDIDGTLVHILPPDNCRGVFERVQIYNRWGRVVFTSNDRYFRWLGLEETPGVYFYHVVFTNREFKGTVSLRD